MSLEGDRIKYKYKTDQQKRQFIEKFKTMFTIIKISTPKVEEKYQSVWITFK